MELVQPDFTAPRHPVDSITEAEHCVLVKKMLEPDLEGGVRLCSTSSRELSIAVRFHMATEPVQLRQPPKASHQ